MGCFNALVSWNIKHLVNAKTNKGVRTVNMKNGIKEIRIMSLAILLNRENSK